MTLSRRAEIVLMVVFLAILGLVGKAELETLEAIEQARAEERVELEAVAAIYAAEELHESASRKTEKIFGFKEDSE